MEFALAAPAYLTDAGSGTPRYFGHWSVAADNEGLSAAEVEAWVHTALNASDYLTQIPIGFVQDASGGGVVFRSVLSLPGNAIGTAYGVGGSATPYVELLASWEGNKDLVNHEAIHAMLSGSHSPEGSVSIMEPLEDPGEEGLSDTDVAQIRAWLGVDGPAAPPEALPPRTDPEFYFHPLDLEHYITPYDFSAVSEVMVSVPVMDAIPSGKEPTTNLYAVWGETKEAIVAGDWEYLSTACPLEEAGTASSAWAPIPSGVSSAGEVYVGCVIKTVLPLATLDLGVTDVRVR